MERHTQPNGSRSRNASMAETGGDHGSGIEHAYREIIGEFNKAAPSRNPVTLMFIKLAPLDRIGMNCIISGAARVLADIRRIIGENIRRDDRELVYGEDELIIILPNTTREGAVRLALKLRRLLESLVFTTTDGTRVSLMPKFGIASHYCYVRRDGCRGRDPEVCRER